jgi:Alpha-mannosidase
MLHGPRDPFTIDAIECAADDVLCPLRGVTLRSALDVPVPVHGVELTGTGLAFSAVKESEDGAWIVVRCVNLLDEPASGSWRFPFDLTVARLARLDETPISDLVTADRRIDFHADPHAIVTILAR